MGEELDFRGRLRLNRGRRDPKEPRIRCPKTDGAGPMDPPMGGPRRHFWPAAFIAPSLPGLAFSGFFGTVARLAASRVFLFSPAVFVATARWVTAGVIGPRAAERFWNGWNLIPVLNDPRLFCRDPPRDAHLPFWNARPVRCSCPLPDHRDYPRRLEKACFRAAATP